MAAGTNSTTCGVAIEDLEIVAAVIKMRAPLRASETRRIAQTFKLIDAAAGLNRALSSYTQHALVHCQGSHGTADIAADTATLHSALREFSLRVAILADEYRAVTTPVAVEPRHAVESRRSHI